MERPKKTNAYFKTAQMNFKKIWGRKPSTQELKEVQEYFTALKICVNRLIEEWGIPMESLLNFVRGLYEEESP